MKYSSKSGFKIVQILIEIVELEEHSKVKLMRSMLVRYYLKLEITWLRYYLKHQNKTIKVFPYQIWVKEDFSAQGRSIN